MVSLNDAKATLSKWSAPRSVSLVLRILPSFILPVLAVAVLLFVAWTSLTYEIPVSAFTRDMATLARFPIYVGVTSSLGAFLMCATAACCLFAVAVAQGAGRTVPWHLFAVGLFSSYLVADDFYEFHDRIFPSLGVPQTLVHVLIAAAAAAITFRWWRNFLAFRPWMLALALAFLGTSMAFDLFDDPLWDILGEWQFFWEDGAKLVGFSFWATYFIGHARHALVHATPGVAVEGQLAP